MPSPTSVCQVVAFLIQNMFNADMAEFKPVNPLDFALTMVEFATGPDVEEIFDRLDRIHQRLKRVRSQAQELTEVISQEFQQPGA